MSKVIHTSDAEAFKWRQLMPWRIFQDLFKYRSLIATMTIRDFKATYQASYLGLTWQVLLPLIMLSIFYFVFGRILGGKFLQSATESPIDYALALFIGLGFFNFLAQNIGSAPSLIGSNATYVKTLSFPLEILSVTSVLNAQLTQVIGLVLSTLALLFAKGSLPWSIICIPFYVLCIFLIAIGVSWGLSALAVFFRDIAGLVSPVTLMLMFLCPIFYPMSMVPKKLRWVIEINPIAIIIENARGCFLYGRWPSLMSLAVILGFSLFVFVVGHFIFMKTKSAFADVM
ncbi:MAG: ABC transporter permease [Candidatus Omnitrophota bacterium]